MENKPKKQRFLLTSIIPQNVSDEVALIDLRELKALVEAAGGEVIDLVTQKREVHDKGLYIGSGKMKEAAEIIKNEKIDVVVLNAIAKPGHLYEMKMQFFPVNAMIEVWDRVDLILEIFSRHAHTAESRLQIELAAMRHMGPRIYGMGMVLSRQAGGIGGRGIGETNTERMKRHWREQMKKAQDKLSKLASDRQTQLERRRRVGLSTVSLVGYTNAGKSSLFNAMTGKHVLVENALFATLDSNVGKLKLPVNKKEILLSDTIGFIQNLPTELIDAFKSTLMESINADLLLHVIDTADVQMMHKIEVVEKILKELGIGDKKQIYVFNKMDTTDQVVISEIEEKYARFSPQFVSTKTRDGLPHLLEAIEKILTTSNTDQTAS